MASPHVSTVHSPVLALGPLLAIETATRTARIALIGGGGECLAEAERTAERHSSNLLPLCDQLFTSTGVYPSGLAAIACGAGPGSFTGLRVGLAVAKGLALPFGTPLLLVSSLHTLAQDLAALPQAGPARHVVPCIDAGKGELHAQVFELTEQGLLETTPAWRLAPLDLIARLSECVAPHHCLVGGPDLGKFSPLRDAQGLLEVLVDAKGPSALAMAKLARLAWARGQIEDLAKAAPTYGRQPDITQPRRK